MLRSGFIAPACSNKKDRVYSLLDLSGEQCPIYWGKLVSAVYRYAYRHLFHLTQMNPETQILDDYNAWTNIQPVYISKTLVNVYH